MNKIIAIASGKGGTGKTFITCNLGVLLSMCQFRVLIVDADVNLANVELVYGFKPKCTLQDYLDGTCTVQDLVQNVLGSVYVVSAGLNLKRRIRPREFDSAIGNIVSTMDFDYVLIDAPAGLDAQVVTSIRMSDGYLLVANPEVTSIVDAHKVKKVVGDTNLLGVVLNKVRKTSIDKRDIEEALGEIIASLPEDPNVPLSINSGIPYVVKHPKSIITKQLMKLTSRITGREVVIDSKPKFWFFRRKTEKELTDSSSGVVK
ncbi:MAG: P-loop NTPase [Archaeoglobaceae archaeon]